MNTKMTLPKDSIVLTSTDRTEIDKVLQALVGKVNIYEKIPQFLSANCGYMLWYCLGDNTITLKKTMSLNDKLCSTASEFLAHFEKPNYIPLEFGSCGVIVYAYGDITFTNNKDGSIFTITSEELNQIVEAQKQLI